MIIEQPKGIVEQYQALEAAYPHFWILYRVGAFYEIFGDLAIEAAKLLKLNLTAHASTKTPMVGFSHSALESYLQKMMALKARVVVYEQSVSLDETGQHQIHRWVDQILTPGTYLPSGLASNEKRPLLLSVGQDSSLTSKDSNYELLSYTQKHTESLYANLSLEALLELIDILKPHEIISSVPLPDALNYHLIPAASPSDKGSALVKSIRTSDKPEALPLLLDYLCFVFQSPSETFGFKPTSKPLRLQYSPLATEALHVFGSSLQPDFSLLALLDHTHSLEGQHLLKDRLRKPWVDQKTIQSHLSVLGWTLSAGPNSSLDDPLFDSLLQGLERVLSSFRLNEKQPSLDAIQLRLWGKHRSFELRAEAILRLYQSLDALFDLACLIKANKPPLEAPAWLDKLADTDLIDKLRLNLAPWIETFEPSGGADLDAPSLLAPTPFGEAPEKELEKRPVPAVCLKMGHEHQKALQDIAGTRERLHAKLNHLHDKLSAYQASLHEKDRAVETLHPADAKAMGLLMLKKKRGKHRYTTLSILQLHITLETYQENLSTLSRSRLNKVLEDLAPLRGEVEQLLAALAQLDVLLSLAKVALKQGWNQPSLGESIRIQKGRHPLLKGQVIPNEFDFQPGDVGLLKGPNMGGKSTYMRTLALIHILAQIGSFVPAEQASIRPFYHILTRMGENDDMAHQLSSFASEMHQLSKALACQDQHKLLLIDEIARGTTHEESLALAYGVLHYLLKEPQGVSLISTHHKTLMQGHNHPRLKALFAQAHFDQGRLMPSYEMSPKPPADSVYYGLEVAKESGLPSLVLHEAKKYLYQWSSKLSKP